MRLVVFSSYLLCLLALRAEAQVAADQQTGSTTASSNEQRTNAADEPPGDVLTQDEWRQVDAAVERALAWLASQQQPDGSFPSLETGQPGVTSLCVMAFVSHGYVPGDDRFGTNLDRAIDFVLDCQKENGLITKVGVDGPIIVRRTHPHLGTTTAYNHAISSLTLSELYGMSEPARAEPIEDVVTKALAATLLIQQWPKDKPEDRGGWRYIDDRDESDSDLSITGWQLMFLRSARNAGFDVPEQAIDDAVAYVRRCYAERYGTFEYWIGRGDGRSRGMAGAGILALAHAGHHDSPEAESTGAWILKQDFGKYNTFVQYNTDRTLDRYHYAVFNCCQGMYQLGGRYWKEFYPRTVRALLANQSEDGSWPTDSHKTDAKFGNAYTTALVVITLGAPNQLLPIFQR
jgi:hypothetical protein